MNDINNCNEEKELIFPTWEERISGIDTELVGERQEGDSHWLEVADMPKAYRRYYERLEAKERRKEERKKLWAKKPSLRSGARGRRHWASKAKTKRRQEAKAWAEHPFSCLIARDKWKSKALDKELWDKWAAPLWERYKPEELEVRWPHDAGTRAKPLSMFNIRIVHKTKGLLLDGTSLEIYYASAPAGALLEAEEPNADAPLSMMLEDSTTA